MVKEYILELLQKNYDIDASIEIDELNYIEEGFVTSLGLLQFIVELEEKFSIEFSEEEISSDEFRVVGTLTKMIEAKLK